ncbi:WD40 repeat-like protein [Thozetella sp. PMI_491]|nr:WD40 repeat-like protein [Thozetella sp. PMI_491]
MAKKARQRISYVLELPNSSPGGHRLGVNGLAADSDNAILYSGGRDGVICSWDLNVDAHDAKPSVSDSSAPPNGVRPKQTTRFRTQTVAHTHWINDIALAQNHSAVVTASSDLLVKLWRPLGTAARDEPATIGRHSDYVKCVATPSQDTPWIATGGLDRKIYLWDLAGGGKTLEIDVSGEEVTEKGSVYALAVNANLMASGGPESIVRLWDPKTGKSIAKFNGHTDNVRAILINGAGDTVLTASSDQTVKVWSVTAGRCMHTLTMHNDSVWSLFAGDPELGVFFSSDRSGLVVRTDVRGTDGELDDGLSVAVAQENEGVSKIVAHGGHIWTATSRSSINRWADVDTSADEVLPESFRQHRTLAKAGRTREGSLSSSAAPVQTPAVNGSSKKEIPLKSILRISNTASFPAVASEETDETPPVARKGTDILSEPMVSIIEPMHLLPEETIEGQFGLVKHRLLNDRKRVLTLDTAGDVLLWDLVKCKPIMSFGKKHLEDVEPEVNTLEAVAPWCSIDTSSGTLTVVLEQYNCFDAEMYADELAAEEAQEFREDQRINLGKWILRYLFANLIDEEIKRDEDHRHKLNEGVQRRIAAARANPPTSITVPQPLGFEPSGSPVTTPKANGSQYPPQTPGLSIGLATPSALTGVLEEAVTPEGKRSSQLSRPSGDKDDYFSNAIHSAADANKAPQTPAAEPASATPAADDKTKTPNENGKDKDKDKEKDAKDKEGGKPGTPFGKKFRMGMSFGTKKLGRSASTTAPEKPAVVDEKTEEQNSESSSNHEKEFDDSFLGVVQRIQNEYEKQLADTPDKPVETKVTPSLPNDTPVLKLPPGTKVIIQEETTGGSAELYRGTVETVGADIDIIEKCSPLWLGEVLLLNAIPQKDPVKVSFVLQPWQDKLPSIAAADGNNRLNANRMLRVKKILAYVAERIDPAPEGEEEAEEDPNALRPEEYLELYCNDQMLPNTMTLATLRAHVWKGGNDIMLYYKANGRKEIPIPPPQPVAPEPPAEAEAPAEPEEQATAAAAAATAA